MATPGRSQSGRQRRTTGLGRSGDVSSVTGSRIRLSAAPAARVALWTAVTLLAVPARAVDVQRMPAPPAAPVERHDPDPLTCQPEAMLAAWTRQLEPFRDQPPAVQARLRAVQQELGTLSLNRCIQRGLLSREQARALAIRMGLESPGSAPPSAAGDQSPSQRP